MGAGENAELVRRGYEAFNSGDMTTLAELFDEAAVWHLPGRSSLANDYRGREATFPISPDWGRRQGAPSGRDCSTCLQMMATAWSASNKTPRSERVSTWKMTP